MSAPPQCSKRPDAPRAERGVHAAAAWPTKNTLGFSNAPVACGRLCGLNRLCENSKTLFLQNEKGVVGTLAARQNAPYRICGGRFFGAERGRGVFTQSVKAALLARDAPSPRLPPERGVHAAAAWPTKNTLGFSNAPVACGRLCGLKAALRPHSAIPPRLAAALTLAFLLLATLTFSTLAAEPWETALARMPLATGTRELNGTNFGPTLLDAFQSNVVVKALVLMPGAIDEFYFFRRARAQLPSAPTLLDAVRALENQTRIRAAFRPPCLLLHAPPDPLTPAIRVTDEATADRLHTRRFPDPLNFFDRDWPRLQSLLTRTFTSIWSGYPEIVPAAQSPDSWHFYRASLRAWNLTPREGLEALTLATRTAVTIEKRRLVFECDPRAAAPAAPPNRP